MILLLNKITIPAKLSFQRFEYASAQENIKYTCFKSIGVIMASVLQLEYYKMQGKATHTDYRIGQISCKGLPLFVYRRMDCASKL